MSTLGHRLAFGWGFSFGVVSMMITLSVNGYHVKGGALIGAMALTFVLMIAAWLQCAKEKRLLL